MRSPTAATLILAAALPALLTAQEPNFGRALASDGTILAVGQPVNWYGPGKVYLYAADPSGRLVEQQRIAASDSSRMDDFGRALALEGNTLAVGAPRKGDGAGTVYLFERSGSGSPWRETARLAAPVGGEFGSALALAGDDLFVGAPASGLVHHYRRSAGRWQPAATLQPGADRLASFGVALAVDGGRLLIGAPTADSGRGLLFASLREGSGNWSAPAGIHLPVPVAPGGARAGSSLILAGSRAWVGAPGAATVFVLAAGSGGAWTVDTVLAAPADLQRRTGAGAAIALVGGELWVGAPNAGGGNGTVIRYPSTPSGWGQPVRLDADSASGNHWPFAFGYSIAALGDRGIVSMPSRDFGEGRVLVAARTGGGWTASQLLTGEIHTIGGRPAAAAECRDGTVGPFTCTGIELVAHLPNSALGGERGAWLNDIWGWTDPVAGRDVALVARRDGTSFVDVTDPSRPQVIGNLPRTAGSPPSVWRDIKVMNDHAYIVADGAGAHGMQIFDLSRLRGAYGSGTIATFAPDSTYREVHSAHNVVADTASGFLYIVGANGGGESCGGGLHMVDARNPKAVSFAGCYNDREGANPRGYTHDAQCLVYRGPDARYRGRQICIGSNEQEINIADVTDKADPKLIGRSSYPDVAYAHQGWFDDEQRYFYMNDELDELNGLVEGTRTIIWDLSELDDPVVAGMYVARVNSSDHNLYVRGNRAFLSNYGSGLRVLDITDRTSPREIGFIDTAPLNDDEPGHSAAQSGAWSNYPFFPSGVVVFTSVREGLFIVKVREPVP